jgi:predicted ATPase
MRSGQRLPSQPTSFVGRTAELAEIARLLGNPACRLLTLLGPGGIGKTRLALAAARQAGAFDDGVVFVALAAVGAPHQLVAAIGDALHLSFTGQRDPTAHLLDQLQARHLLLLLDNFEHLLDGADFVYDILERAPRISLLITSRARLNLQAEWVFDVEGLTYPSDKDTQSPTPTLAALTEYSAVQLFVQRATQVQPGLALSAEMLATMARICQHVAGAPLAIELAAASLRMVPIGEVERQIHANLYFALFENSSFAGAETAVFKATAV